MNTEKMELLQFLSSLTGYPVNEETILFHDIGLAGIDAETFMIEFSKKYNVNLENFDSSKYYTDENDIFNIFKPFILRVFKGKPLKDETFNIDHLLKVIHLKRWVDP